MKKNIPTSTRQGACCPNFRFVLLVFLIFGNLQALLAQRNLSLFNLNGAPQSYGLNPGRMPMNNAYLTIPALGNLNASYNNNGFNYSSIVPEADTSNQDTTRNFFDVGFQSFLNNIGAENRLLFDLNASWLDFGVRSGRNFFSISANDNINLQVDYPKAFFQLLNEIDLGDTISGKVEYDLSNLGVNMLHYRSFAFGYTRQITPNFSAGARIKLLSGLGTIFSENSRLKFTNDPMNTTLQIDGSLEVSSSGLSTISNNTGAYLRGGGNSGMAFDVGANYSTEKLDISASILNIGSITWKNDLTQDGISSAKFQFPTNDLDAFEAEFNRFTDSISLKRDSVTINPFRTTLPAMGYFAANYYFLPQTSANILINPRYFNGEIDMAYSLGAQTRIGKILQVGLNYSYFNKNVFNLGASASVNLGPLQIFAATDNLPAVINWQNAANAHINAGLSLSFSRRTREEQLALWTQEKEEEEEEAVAENETNQPEEQPSEKKSKQKETSADNPAKEETRSDKANASAKTRTRTEESTETPETEEPAIVLRKYFSYRGSAKDMATGEPIKGIRVDAYVMLPDGKQQLAFTRNFFTGEFEVLMERNKTYRITLHKENYFEHEVVITPQQMKEKNEILEQVQLKK